MTPPRVARHWLAWVTPSRLRESFLDDLDEAFDGVAAHRGAARARRWYWKQAFAGTPTLLAMSLNMNMHTDETPRRLHGSGGFGLDPFWFDLRTAARALRRAPWFTTIAVLTCALGVGLSLAVFSVVDRLMFRPLPYAHPDELVQIDRLRMTSGTPFLGLEQALVVEAHRASRTLAGVAYAQGAAEPRDLGTPEAPTPVCVAEATYNLLSVLGVRPVLGRDFTEDDARGRRQVVLVSHAYWRAHLGADAAAVGQRLGGGARAPEIIGVLPPDFLLPSSLFMERLDALALGSETFDAARRGQLVVAPVARLRPGATAGQAEGEMNSLLKSLAETQPGVVPMATVPQAPPISVRPLREGLTYLYRQYLGFIVGGVGVVLLLAATSLATLLVSRGQARTIEIGIRTALGASSRRVVATALYEAAIVAVAGAAVAWGVLVAARRVMIDALPIAFRGFPEAATDGRVVGFAVLAAAVTVAVSILPVARVVLRRDLSPILQRGGRGGSRAAARKSRWLLAVQAALGVLLVAGAVGALRSFAGMAWRSPGFVPDDLYEVATGAGFRMPADTRVAGALEAIHGVTAVQQAGAASTMLEFLYPSRRDFWETHGAPGWELGVSAGFLEALGTPVRAGRTFVDADGVGPAPVAVLTERAVRALWPGVTAADAIGREFAYTGGALTRVIGVVADIRARPGGPIGAGLFLPYGTAGVPTRSSSMYLAVRMPPGVRPDAAQVAARIKEQLGNAALSVKPFSAIVEPDLERPRFEALLFSLLASVALLVAAIALFAVASHDAAVRRYEMGVRLTLGAGAAQLQRLLIGGALRPVVIGVVAGLAGAWWVARFVQSLFFEVDPRDPTALLLVALVLIATAAGATWLPARRAARTDPSIVLRAQ